MPQLSFIQNYNFVIAQNILVSGGSLTFIPYEIWDSISFKTLNLLFLHGTSSTFSHTISLGLYSLTGSTLSLANSISGNFTGTNSTGHYWQSFTGTSATQNITPGIWWWGVLISTGNASIRIVGAGTGGRNPQNAFPGGFIGGAMTASTSALPTSYATSDLDIAGGNELGVPYIILSS